MTATATSVPFALRQGGFLRTPYFPSPFGQRFDTSAALEEFFQVGTIVGEQWATFWAGPHENPTLVRADLKPSRENDLQKDCKKSLAQERGQVWKALRAEEGLFVPLQRLALSVLEELA
jgi:hypothetical protein